MIPNVYDLVNARVRTVDPRRPTASALRVAHGHITHIDDLPIDGTPRFDLGGRVVIPGFVDSHTHPSMVSKSMWHVRLPWTTDVDEILAFIRAYGAAHPKEEAPYLYFEYYPSATFGEQGPTKELLDSAISDRPVLCQDFSEHEHWVNSRMLDLMGITAETPDPVPGLEMFVRDEHGEPTGLLRELVHVRFLDTMFDRIGWRPPEDLTVERIRPFFDFMTAHGVTSLFEALVEDPQIFASVAELDRRGELNLHYSGALRFRNLADLPDALERVQLAAAQFGSDRVRISTLKLFLDGTNESGNSAVLEPFVGGGTGAIGMEAAELTECLLLANAAAVDIHIHLVGDRAFRVACNAVEAARQRLRELWQIQVTLAHCELVDPLDMTRPAELGILINWTPHWSGGYFGDEARRHLGDERWNRMYRFTEFIASGTTVALSSDVVSAYELARGNPFFGMQVAHTRIDPEYPLDPAQYPESMRPASDARLDREAMLTGYTLAGARQLRLEDRVGSLEVGKLANLNVLHDDLFGVPGENLHAIHIDAVVFEGRVVAGAFT
ncbi:MAG: amidohydrolase family protein [Actinobacteria bacterium]|nr:amidohydrolase family protein [Actinomycetota bacterium]